MGVTSRALGEDGRQKRETAEKYRQQADKTKFEWPRTSVMLRRIADFYEQDAIRWDRRSELED